MWTIGVMTPAERVKARAGHLRRKYGLTPQQYARMLKLQGGRCKLCHREPKTRRLDVDHDHQTKRVRGLLCFRCNHRWVAQNTAASAPLLLPYLRSTFDGRNL